MTRKFRSALSVNLIGVLLMVASACQVLAVDPVVSRVQAKQREGSRLVDISYDVTDPDSPTLTVYLKISADGGVTWKGPVELVSGDVGRGVVPGAGKRLMWDAGKEMPNKFGVKYRYRIGADDWQVPIGMAPIPAGPFKMGDAWVSPLVGVSIPEHTVTVSAFSMDQWEVSIELWESVRAWGNANGYDLVAGGSFGAKHPVHSVNWWDVVKWNNARSEKEGKVPAYYEDGAMTQVYRSGEKAPAGVKWDAGYRLPTEAEWEKAARGGVAGKLYPWGTDEISAYLANYNASKISSPEQLQLKGKTTSIGSYGATGYGLYDMAGNVYGLYDMAGNVVEWTWDWAGEFAQTAQTDPRGPTSGSSREVRGGGWVNEAEHCRVGFRSYTIPGNRSPAIGFRSVLPLGQP